MNIDYQKAQRILYMLLSLVSVFYLSGCKEDKYIGETGNEEHGTPVTVTMSIKVATYTTPQTEVDSSSTRGVDKGFVVTFDQSSNKVATRASSGTTSLYNLWVLQFNKEGAVRKVTKIEDVPEPIKDMVTIDAELYEGTDQTIYLVALGKNYSDVSLAGIKSTSELEKYTLDYLKYENGVMMPRVTKEEEVPYWGYHSGIDIIQLGEGGKGYIKYDPVGNFNGGISMRAMLAKVTMDLSYVVSGFTPFYLMVKNVPTKFAVNSAHYTPTSFTDLEAQLMDVEVLKDGGRSTYTWYLPPNPQGTVPAITSQSMRYYYILSDGKVNGTAPPNGTYINLCASDQKDEANYAFYYVFLGCNTTNDFNVFPASYYNMRTDINVDPNANDKRVVANKLKQSLDISVSATKELKECFTNNDRRAHENYDLDAHTSMRPIEVTMIRGSVTVSVLDTENKNAAPISQENSWLRLSTYSNYTDAYNEEKRGKPNGLNTSLTLRANIPKVFKLYMYNDEYEEYSMNETPKKRSLYIRFAFQAESGSGTSATYIVRMDQRSAFYVGQFGGDERRDDGSYPQGLVFESIRETVPPGCKYLSYYKSSVNIYRGYYKTDWGQLTTYDVENKVSGRSATRFLSENPEGFSYQNYSNAKVLINAPRWVNGLPDLYQYDYYLDNGFAVRYCYDKNRDSNGNGQIDDDELIWYMPSYYQNLGGVNFSYHGTNSTIGKLFPPNATGLYSVTMFNFKEAYNIYNDIPCLRNTDVSTKINQERCVRNVKLAPANLSFPIGAKVSTDGGYAVVDATGFIAGSYADNTTTRFFTNSNGRVIRHTLYKYKDTDKDFPVGTLKYDVCKKVSARFRVAPKDLSTELTWAEASGFVTTGNQSPVNTTLDSADTGCAAYDSTNPGKWRLPTGRELVLIEMMEGALGKTSGTTGFQKFAEGKSYWSATEKDETGYYAYVLTSTRYLDDAALYLKSEQRAVRCIQDLPAK